jgi:hypothetical protein
MHERNTAAQAEQCQVLQNPEEKHTECASRSSAFIKAAVRMPCANSSHIAAACI